MPEISIQKQCATLTDLVDYPPGEPVGGQTDSVFFKDGNLEAGTWECEPGTLKHEFEFTEFCHMLKGRWILTSESGQVTEINAGDSWIFPRGWKGTSEVVETVRKVWIDIN